MPGLERQLLLIAPLFPAVYQYMRAFEPGQHFSHDKCSRRLSQYRRSPEGVDDKTFEVFILSILSG